MTNWTFKQKPNNSFMESFSPQVQKYLGIDDGFPSGDPARWLLDAFQLTEAKWPNNYGDYSFIVVPASKGLEYWLLKVADDLGVRVSERHSTAGGAQTEIEKNLDALLNGIDDKVKDKLEREIRFLKNFVEEYRNDIVHSDKKIDSVEQAKSKVIEVFSRINSVTKKLMDGGLIKG